MFDEIANEEFSIMDFVDESQPFEPEFTEDEWNSFGIDDDRYDYHD
jgi:hypothetical protein